MKNKRFAVIIATAAILLSIPFIAMQFTNDVNWNTLDFASAGFLLFGSGLLCEFVIRKVKSFKYKIAACGIVLLVFFLIWAELAVGIFGTSFAGS